MPNCLFLILFSFLFLNLGFVPLSVGEVLLVFVRCFLGLEELANVSEKVALEKEGQGCVHAILPCMFAFNGKLLETRCFKAKKLECL